MDEKVDVLAVMEAMTVWARLRDDPEWKDKADEARAAVAELIEAVDKLFGADMEYCMEMDGKEDQLQAVHFAKSALARVKGE